MTQNDIRAISAVLVLGVGTQAVGCVEATSSVDAGRDAGPLMAAGEFYEAWVTATEDANTRCWTDPWHQGPLDLGLPHHAGAEIDALVAEHAVVFDPTLAAECLAWLASAPCPDDPWGYGLVPPDACRRALLGTRPGDSFCLSSLECQSGACYTNYGCPGFCGGGAGDAGWDTGPAPDAGMLDADLPDPSASRCLPAAFPVCANPTRTALEGEPCATPEGALCIVGLVCGHDEFFTGDFRCEAPYESGGRCHHAIPEGCPVGEVCDGTVCVALPGDGEPCAIQELGGRSVCAAGLACIGSYADGAFSQTCRPLAPVGGMCTPDTYCASNRCTPAGVCVETTVSYCPWWTPPTFPDVGPPPHNDQDS